MDEDITKELEKLKKQLGAHNFDFGNDPNRYTTEQATGYLWDAETAKGAQGVMAKAVKDDLRQSHFALGHDEPLYETDAQRSSRCGEITTERLDQMRADGQTARALKELNLGLKGELTVTSAMEKLGDALFFGAILGRIEASSGTQAVTRGTIVYLQRRGWRYLRNLVRAVP